MLMLTVRKEWSKCIDKGQKHITYYRWYASVRDQWYKKCKKIDVNFVTPIQLSWTFNKLPLFFTSTKIIRTKTKIWKTASYFRHGMTSGPRSERSLVPISKITALGEREEVTLRSCWVSFLLVRPLTPCKWTIMANVAHALNSFQIFPSTYKFISSNCRSKHGNWK